MTTWFAQNSGVNIDSVNQWNDAPNGSGNWLTWVALGASDVLVANGKTSIAINVDVTCAVLTTGTIYGGTAGGGFLLSTGRTLTANVLAGSSSCVVLSGTSSASIVGSVTGGTSPVYGVDHNSTGTLTITGNVTGGSAANSFGVRNTNTSGGTVSITGNVTGGFAANAFGLFLERSNSAGLINGNAVGGANATAHGVAFGSSGTCEIVGNLVFGVAQPVMLGSGSKLYVNGSIQSESGGRLYSGNGLVFVKNTGTQTIVMQSYTDGYGAGISRTLSTAGANQAATSDVRSGVSYGGGTGTLAVPNPAYVSLGVPTDNTVGTLTAGLDESALHDALDSYTNKAAWKATGFATVNPDNAGIREAAVNSAIAAGHTIE